MNATYADILRPIDKTRAAFYDFALILGGSVVIALCAQIVIPLPIIPITGQTFAVLMAGALLGSRRGSLCILAYLTEGLVGLPVFAMGKFGPAALLSPTGGYLVGFLAAAWVTGFLSERGWDRRVWTTALAMLMGTVCIYAFGLVWLGCLTGSANVLACGLYPFVIGDLLKIILAAFLLPTGWKLIHKNSEGF